MEKPAVTPTEIRLLLKLTGWTQTELASRLGLSRSLISNWLARDRVPTSPPSILMRQWLAEAKESREGATV